jgi:hypothetical protein
MASPGDLSYNRIRYYSALRTGYKQLNPNVKESFLKTPTNVANPLNYFVHVPLQAAVDAVVPKK